MEKRHKTIILITILLSSLFIGIVKAVPYEAWLNYRILNFNDGFEGLQVTFNVTYGHGDNGLNFNCKENFEDLRFLDYETDELLPAWNKTTINKNYCEIWLKLGISKNVTMKYNNPNAESYWDVNAVFDIQNEGIWDSGVVLVDFLVDYSDLGVGLSLYGSGSYGFSGSDIELNGYQVKNVTVGSGSSAGFHINDYDDVNITNIDYIVFGVEKNMTASGWFEIQCPDWNNCYGMSVVCVNDGILNDFRFYMYSFENASYVRGSPSNVIDEYYLFCASVASGSAYFAFTGIYYVSGNVYGRVWVTEMPQATFGSEYSNPVLEMSILAILAFIIALFSFLLVISYYRKRSEKT